jgi:chromosome segregation ATPase
MSDTPRTDEISRGYLSVPIEWAKTLEKELTEAREIVEMQKETMRQMREQYGFGERNVMRELRQEIENLNKIIDAATNSANASHLRAIEYQSQRGTLAEALTELLDALGATRKPYELIGYGIAEHRAQEIAALAAVKGGDA